MIPTKERLRDAAIRAVRTFVTVFAATLGGVQADALDLNAAKAAAIAAGSAAIAVVWRLVLDPSPIPSLNPEEQA